MSWDRPEISRSVRQSFNKNTHTHRKEETNPKMQVWDPEDDELPSFLWNNRWRPFFFGSLIDATMPNHPILEVLKNSVYLQPAQNENQRRWAPNIEYPCLVTIEDPLLK